MKSTRHPAPSQINNLHATPVAPDAILVNAADSLAAPGPLPVVAPLAPSPRRRPPPPHDSPGLSSRHTKRFLRVLPDQTRRKVLLQMLLQVEEQLEMLDTEVPW